MAENQESGELLSDPQEEDEGPLEASHEMDSSLTVTAATSLKCPWVQRSLTLKQLSCCNPITWLRRLPLFLEMIKIFKLTVPIFLMFFFQQLLFFISVMMVGHSTGHSKTELDAAALANSVVNVSGLSVVVGLTSAADTLCPQAYGFKNYKKVGVILQRGILIVSLVCLPIAAVWLNTESILLLLHQPPCVARLTGQFVQIFVLALLPMLIYVMLQKYLQAQSLVWVFVVVGFLQNVANVVFASLFIYVAGITIPGSSLSLVLSYVLTPFILVAYIWGRGLHKQTWKGWSWESLMEWGLFFKFGVPGLFMVCFEWWTFEISTVVAGAVNELQLAVNTVLMQFGMIMYAIPLGVGTAASVRIGNELGAGNPQKAKRAAYAALLIEGIIALFFLAFFAATRTFIAGVFTSEQDVIEETAKAMIPGTFVFFFDQFQGTFAGIIRGCGRQKIGAIMNFAYYYLIGLPIGISLALLTDLGATGMWIGLLIAVFITDITYMIIVWTTKWKKISEWAMKNAADHNDSLLSPEVSAEKMDENDSSVSDTSVVSTGTYSEELGEGSPHKSAATSLNELEEDKDEGHTVSNGNIIVEEVPLVSFEDVECFDTTETHPPPPSSLMKERSRLFKKRLWLFSSKGLFYVVGLLLVAVGGILVFAFQHSDVTEMCTLDGETNSSLTIVSPSIFAPPTTVFMPSPTATLPGQVHNSYLVMTT